MQTADFTSILKDAPAGEWIALSHDEDRVVATSPDLENAIALAKDCGEAEPVLLKVPSTSMLVL